MCANFVRVWYDINIFTAAAATLIIRIFGDDAGNLCGGVMCQCHLYSHSHSNHRHQHQHFLHTHTMSIEIKSNKCFAGCLYTEKYLLPTYIIYIKPIYIYF